MPVRRTMINLPPLSEQEYQTLKEDIRGRGVLVPIEFDEEGQVLDGGHRLRACKELADEGIKISYSQVVRRGMTDDEKTEHALKRNLARRHLSRDQLKGLAVQLRQTGWTQERIGVCLGVSQKTVSNWVGDVSNLTNVSLPETIEDSLGRKQPTKKERKPAPPKTIFAPTPKDLNKALEAAKTIPDEQWPDRPLTMREAKKKASVEKRREIREAAAEDNETEPDIPIIVGDFRAEETQLQLMELMEPGSVDLIFTDPSYAEKNLDLYKSLAQFAKFFLRPGGSLVAYAGSHMIGEIIHAMQQHLTWWWMIVDKLNGPYTTLNGKRVLCRHKPLLWFVKDKYDGTEWVVDVIESTPPDKTMHDWQQSLTEAEYCIQTICPPGGVVLDPMCGAGTTLIAAIRKNRRAVGIALEEETAARATNYVKNAA